MGNFTLFLVSENSKIRSQVRQTGGRRGRAAPVDEVDKEAFLEEVANDLQ